MFRMKLPMSLKRKKQRPRGPARPDRARDTPGSPAVPSRFGRHRQGRDRGRPPGRAAAGAGFFFIFYRNILAASRFGGCNRWRSR